MAVNVQATFKKDEREYNGLERAREDFIMSPLERRTIVATVEVTTIKRDIRDGGTETPTVRLVNVEVLEGEDALTGRKLLEAAYHERTGQAAPPPSLFDDGVPGQDAAGSGREDDDGPPWPGDDAAPAQADEVAAKRGRRK